MDIKLYLHDTTDKGIIFKNETTKIVSSKRYEIGNIHKGKSIKKTRCKNSWGEK